MRGQTGFKSLSPAGFDTENQANAYEYANAVGDGPKAPPRTKNARYTPASTTQLTAGGCSASSAASVVACSAAAETGPVLAADSAERAATLCSWLGEKPLVSAPTCCSSACKGFWIAHTGRCNILAEWWWLVQRAHLRCQRAWFERLCACAQTTYWQCKGVGGSAPRLCT